MNRPNLAIGISALSLSFILVCVSLAEAVLACLKDPSQTVVGSLLLNSSMVMAIVLMILGSLLVAYFLPQGDSRDLSSPGG